MLRILFFRCIFATAIILLSLSFASASSIQSAIASDYGYLKDFYIDLYQHPELSFHENKTAEKIANELRFLGFGVTLPVGGTGLVGVLKNGNGSTLMLRTDLDALPVKEQTGLSYASTQQVINDLGRTVNVLHACGHDVHMTVFIGTARQLVSLKDQWQGTLILVGHPAEERGAGARMMLADGLFERFPRPDYNLALHVFPELAAWTVS